MNKAQIKAELRRSACEDFSPFLGLYKQSFDIALCFMSNEEFNSKNWTNDQSRIFILLVAEAL